MLTREEEKILEGEFGPLSQFFMENLVVLGESNDSERMVKIKRAHIAGISYKTVGNDGMDLISDIQDKRLEENNRKIEILATTNPCGIDTIDFEKFNFPEDYVKKQKEILDFFNEIGCIPSYSCTPYYREDRPKPHEIILWAESSAVIFANSVLGARTNDEPGWASLFGAYLGRYPLYGLHLDENRISNIGVKLGFKPKDSSEWSLVGYYVGKKIRVGVPTFLDSNPSIEDMKALGASLATTGRFKLFYVGTNKLNSHFQQIEDIVTIEKKEIAQTKIDLSQNGEKIDLVVFGCPHCSKDNLRQISQMIGDKKINSHIDLWICTSRLVKKDTEMRDILRNLEKKGVKVMADTCMVVAPLRGMGYENVITDSTKAAYHMKSSELGELNCSVMSTKEAINLATRG